MKKKTTRRRLSRQDRHSHLLAVAKQIVLEEGVSALTMERLAERSGFSKPVIYDHFSNREDVSISILKDSQTEIVKAVVESTEDCETIYEYLSNSIDAIFEFESHRDSAVQRLTNGFSSTSSVNEIYLAQQRRSQVALQNLLMQQGVEEDAAEVLGHMLFVLEHYSIAHFSRGKKRSLATDVMKKAIFAMIDSFAPAASAKPIMPVKFFEDSELEDGPAS